MIKKLASFEDSVITAAAFAKLGFSVEVDDAVNGIYYVESDLTNFDWMAVLSLLEDCKRENLQPMLIIDDECIASDKAIEYADLKASGELI